MEPNQLLKVAYRATRTMRAFHGSGAFVRGIMGPVGSGKSTAMCMELLLRALGQQPGPDGVRRTRYAVVRNTYPELRTTTLKTWADWIPPQLCPVSATAPMTARLMQPLADGTSMDMEVFFLALDRAEDARKLLSLELTGAWINEAREVPREVLDGLSGRVGRYPPKRLGGPTWSGVIMDTNPPEEDHWWYRLAEEERPEGFAFFRQPPALLEDSGGYALNPMAENLEHQPLGGQYWLRQAPGKPRSWVQVYLLGRYGTVSADRPVYPEYDDALHLTVEPLKPLAGVPVILGWDFGLTPACVAVQLAPDGRLLVIAEWLANDMGIRAFARQVVAPEVRRRFAGWTVQSYGDPAGMARVQTDERTCMDELAAAGLPTRPARSNSFTARREAVAGFLTGGAQGAGLLLSPACPALRKGFLSGYRLERLPLAGHEARYADRPAKNRYSHVHDALQYAALEAEERERALAKKMPSSTRRLGSAMTTFRPADADAGY